MSSNLASEAEPAVTNLLDQDPEQLYAELGRRLHAMASEASLAGSFEPEQPESLEFAPLDTLRTAGKDFFRRISVQAYHLVCGTDAADDQQRNQLMDAFGSGTAGVGGLLAVLLVSQLGLAPAAAGVVAALIIKLFFRPAYEAMCAAWKASLPQSTAPGQPAG